MKGYYRRSNLPVLLSSKRTATEGLEQEQFSNKAGIVQIGQFSFARDTRLEGYYRTSNLPLPLSRKSALTVCLEDRFTIKSDVWIMW